jgi:hypothetical protein
MKSAFSLFSNIQYEKTSSSTLYKNYLKNNSRSSNPLIQIQNQQFLNDMNNMVNGVQVLNKNRWKDTRPIPAMYIHYNPPAEDMITINANSIVYSEKVTETEETLLNSNVGLGNVYIISNIFGGGTKKYKYDIMNNYTGIEFYQIKSKNEIYEKTFNSNDIIFVQQLLFTDIDASDILQIKEKYKSKIVVTIHDFYWFIESMDQDLKNPFFHKNYLFNSLNIHPEIRNLFKHADVVIHPSKFTLKEYNKRFPLSKGKYISHNDYFVDYSTKNIPPIKDKTINVGYFHEYSEYKGQDFIQKLEEQFTEYKKYKLKYFISGVNIQSYNEMEDFKEQLLDNNIHFLVLLNKWGETYCYSLTKYINAGLPILYNNFGSCKERIPKDVEHYISVFENESEIHNDSLLLNKFTKMLNYVIENNGKYNTSNFSKQILYNNCYNHLFGGEINYTNLHKMVKPFCVYFPQFQKLKENDVNYYPDMTDIKNLAIYKMNDPKSNMETPCLKTFSLSKQSDYDLTNPEIIQKQVNLATEYGIYGFAVYYYWFSINSITNNHTIMEKCYNNFFNGKVKLSNNFKIYFIWANEDWSNNPAFNSNEKIYNIYDAQYFQKNIANLIPYFKHENYYKIDEKPVFYIHHPWFIPEQKLFIFYNMLHLACKKNNFKGVHLVVNNMVKTYNVMNNYNFFPDYKKNKTLDYNEFIENSCVAKNFSKCIFFHFDNRPRLYVTNNFDKVSVYYNNTYEKKCFALEKILENYEEERSEINKILLINSWNEWGEQMSVEPSNERGFDILNIIKFKFFRYL